MPSSLQAATVPTPDWMSLQYTDSRSSCRLRPRRPTRTPLAYLECCDKPWNPPAARGSVFRCRRQRGAPPEGRFRVPDGMGLRPTLPPAHRVRTTAGYGRPEPRCGVLTQLLGD